MEKQQITNSITRREALRRGLVGAAGLALSGSLSRRGAGSERLFKPTGAVCGFASEGQVCYTNMDVGRPVPYRHV